MQNTKDHFLTCMCIGNFNKPFLEFFSSQFELQAPTIHGETGNSLTLFHSNFENNIRLYGPIVVEGVYGK